MARNANQTSNYDYPVIQEKLFTGDGKETEWFVNRRTDTNQNLGICTEQYGLVQNADVFGAADDAIAARGLVPTDRNVYVSDNGARARLVLDFKDHTIKLPQVGDTLGMRLIVNNSFDRSLRLSFMLGLLRLVCTNGMKALDQEFSLTKRHSKKTSIDDLITNDALDSALDSFSKTGDTFARLANTAIEQEQGLNILQNLAKGNVLSEKVREGIAGVWNAPTYEEDSARNLYNLYNATTQHLTRDVAAERFEYSERVNTNVLKKLSAASQNETKLAKLVKALPIVETDLAKN
jgi:hypothetical protein